MLSGRNQMANYRTRSRSLGLSLNYMMEATSNREISANWIVEVELKR